MSGNKSVWKVKPTKGYQGSGDGEDREIPDAGQQPAVCVGLIDMGTHEDDYDGKKKSLRRIALVWELTDAPMSGYKGRNHVLVRDYNHSFGTKANLRKLVEKWFGKALPDDDGAAEFDLTLLIDPKFSKCVANVVHGEGKTSGKAFAKLEDVSRPHKSMVVPEPKHTPFVWNVGDDLAEIPEWVPWLYGRPIADVVKESQELSGRKTVEKVKAAAAPADDEGDVGGDEPADDIPF